MALQEARNQRIHQRLAFRQQILKDRIKWLQSLDQTLSSAPTGGLFAVANLVPLKGSELPLKEVENRVSDLDANQRVEFVVHLRAPSASALRRMAEELGTQSPRARRYMTREEFGRTYGAAAKDTNKVLRFARENGFRVIDSNTAERIVILSGRAAAVNEVFEIDLGNYTSGGHTYRAFEGEIQLPSDLQPIVDGVFGLSTFPVARKHSQRPSVQPHAPGRAFTPLEVASLYNFPQGVDGTGQCVAIIEMGGGFRTGDLQIYFGNLGLTKQPTVVAVPVASGSNHPGGSADDEVMLDIEVAGALAPGALLAVYFAPNTTRGFIQAVSKAVHDKQHKPSVISISWGGAEITWSASAKRVLNQVLLEAAILGVTVTVASGDTGSSDSAGRRANVDFPASSPFALGCGGTRLEEAANTISREVVWNDDPRKSASGGGVSEFFRLPAYQQNANVPPSVNPPHRIGRGVPDVAGNADPNTGYKVRVDGQDLVIGGTSAVAPLWAGLLTLINQKLGTPVGFINPRLYSLDPSSGAFQDIIVGDNGAYQAGEGWDACTGWGSPNGNQLLQALSGG
jgi:kumamolisin